MNKDRYWNDVVKSISPYVPGEQPRDKKYIKLNTNENPYPPSPAVITAIQRAAEESLNLYPDPDASQLKQVCAQEFNCSQENIFVGNGSDEVLAFAFQAFFNPGDTLLYPDISYSFYPVWAKLYSLQTRELPLDDQFKINLADYSALDNQGIVIPNPNAPTGIALALEEIKSFLDSYQKGVFILDEAYIDFGAESAAGLINDYPNLLVVQTLSKGFSLAGLRVGFAIASEGLIEALERVKNSFNSYTLDRLAIAGASAALKDKLYYDKMNKKTCEVRDSFCEEAIKKGYRVLSSASNFVFLSPPDGDAEALFLWLREKAVLVRYFKKDRIASFLRISIGKQEDMQLLSTLLAEYLIYKTF